MIEVTGDWKKPHVPKNTVVHFNLNAKAEFVRGTAINGQDFEFLQDPQGYKYSDRRAKKDGRVLWRCKWRKSGPKGTGCKAKALTKGLILETVFKQHNHAVDHTRNNGKQSSDQEHVNRDLLRYLDL